MMQPEISGTYKPVFGALCSILAAVALLCAAFAVPAHADEDPSKRLKELEQILEAKRKEKATLEEAYNNAATEAERLSRELVIAGHDIQQTEENASRLEQRITTLETEVKNKQESLSKRQDELLILISSLERLSRRPAALALLQPSEALTTARSASVMGTIVPQITVKADGLRADLKSLAVIQEKLSKERFTLKNTLVRLTEHQLKLASLLQKRQDDASSASSAALKTGSDINKLAKEAKSLRELLENLARRKAAEELAAKRRPVQKQLENGFKPNSQPMSKMKGLLSLPVVGTIIEHYGDKLAVGTAHGIKIKSRENAQVVSPYDGQIVFAGPFRDYGNLIIIEHKGGYHSLLAGIGELYNTVGQWVLSGEPVGVMNRATSSQDLYLEIRERGQAINPETWLKK
ncbi:murein hydrolase activator EnvC family protein [Kordiimonas pumila]|uniref:Murein hydrolase activator EnvC family protein n=1 Tax=Kordiimonas pumila TaxID=2161677 RepID=A0ABV7D7A9_9PROT|nr:peptidoglycan DD-metalloendopeptidase family protein [Kordiimonas pumila]